MSRFNRSPEDVENIKILHNALFDGTSRKDKDVTATIAKPFLKYNRNGLDLDISFRTSLSNQEEQWAFALVKKSMESVYDISGYGWDDDDKRKELTEAGTRFLLVREAQDTSGDENTSSNCASRLVGFAHFRFTVQGDVIDQMKGETSLHLWDIHLEDHVQRKGLGRHLLMVLELIARQQAVKLLSVPIMLGHDQGLAWICSMKGFGPDESLRALLGFDSELEGFDVYCKVLGAPIKAVARTPVTATCTTIVSSAAATTASSSSESQVISADITVGADCTVAEAVEELRALFREEHRRDASEEEVLQWESVLFESAATAAITDNEEDDATTANDKEDVEEGWEVVDS